MKKFAVILSGCGVNDGSEIHEATMFLLAINQLGAQYQCFSVDKNQTKVVNSITGEEINETRNVMIESARIARGEVKNIKELNVNEFDAIVFPGGYGAALNLCDFALKGNPDYSVDKDIEKAILDFKNNNKIICASCIAPIILAKVLKNITITLGNDKGVASVVEALGNKFQETKSGDICVDKENKVITSPFYMLAQNISTIYDEAIKVIKEAINM